MGEGDKTAAAGEKNESGPQMERSAEESIRCCAVALGGIRKLAVDIIDRFREYTLETALKWFKRWLFRRAP